MDTQALGLLIDVRNDLLQRRLTAFMLGGTVCMELVEKPPPLALGVLQLRLSLRELPDLLTGSSELAADLKDLAGLDLESLLLELALPLRETLLIGLVRCLPA